MVGMAGVCLVAWMVGIAIRHNVAVVEPLADHHHLVPAAARLDRASDLVIVVAYVISVALYLRILALFIVGYVSSGSGASESPARHHPRRADRRGRAGARTRRAGPARATGARLGAGAGARDRRDFAGKDASRLRGGGLRLPPVPSPGLVSVALVFGGIVITVQGFATCATCSASTAGRVRRLPAIAADLRHRVHPDRRARNPLMGLVARSGQIADSSNSSGASLHCSHCHSSYRRPGPVPRRHG